MCRLTLADILLVVSLLLVPVRGLLLARHAPSPAAVEVWRDGRFFGRFSLSQEQIVQVGQDYCIEIRGGVRVAETDCPLKLCQQMGWQSLPGRTIVCVPNRVVITIVSGNEPEYDAESY